MRQQYTYMIILIMWSLCLTNTVSGDTIFQSIGIASSPNPVGSGARAVGMGGAFIAIADDATAASWNPAGLIQLESPEISIVGAFTNNSEDIFSQSHPEADTTGKTDGSNLNYLSATYPFSLFDLNMVASLNYQRLYEFNRNFDYHFNLDGGAITTSEDRHYSQDGYLGAMGLAYAIQVAPSLSLGATINFWTDNLGWRNGWTETFTSQSKATITIPPFPPFISFHDKYIMDKYSDFTGENFNFGLLWEVTGNLTVGAVLKTPFTASIHHESIEETTQKNAAGNIIASSRINTFEDVTLDMPLSYGMGIAWRVSDALSFDLDIYKTHWSDYILTDSQGNKFSPIDGRYEADSDVSDTIQVRMGTEYLFINPNKKIVIPLRAGVFYDPEPFQDDNKDFYGVSIGSGIAYKKIVFDIAYQLRWGKNVDTGNLITNSKGDVTQHLVLASIIIHF